MGILWRMLGPRRRQSYGQYRRSRHRREAHAARYAAEQAATGRRERERWLATGEGQAWQREQEAAARRASRTGWYGVYDLERHKDGRTAFVLKAHGRPDLAVTLEPGVSVRYAGGAVKKLREGDVLSVTLSPDGTSIESMVF